jgi:O-antigen/teichoic acid export membrane protein
MAHQRFAMGDFIARWLGALALVMVTFNPTPYSYASWVLGGWGDEGPGDDLPLKALAGVVLLILYVIFLRSTFRSIGALGVVLAAMLCGAILWVAVDWGWLDPLGGDAMIWIGLVVVATILAIGMSWSHVRRQLSGQADVDDVDER